MSSIVMNVNTIDGLTSLKDNLNKVICEKINGLKKEEAYKSVDSRSIGECKYIMENIYDRLYDSNKGQKLIGKYIKAINENASLKRFYTLYEEIKGANGIKSPHMFLSEAVSMSKPLTSCDKYRRIVSECIKLLNIDTDELKAMNENYNESLDSKISFILSSKRNVANMKEHTNAMSVICENIDSKNTNVSESIDKDINDIISESDNEWERNAIKDMFLYTTSGKGKERLFEDYKSDCISLLNDALDNTEVISEQNNFQNMINGLTDKKYNADTFTTDLFKLSELRHTLK